MIVKFYNDVKPDVVTLVPERRGHAGMVAALMARPSDPKAQLQKD